MAIGTCITVGLVIGLILTILCYVLVIPKKKDGQLNKFFQFLHDVFRFKKLFIESVLRFFYVLITIVCVTVGFFMLFGQIRIGTYVSGSTFLTGLLVMILGPILTRISFECSMLFIFLVKNTIEINAKLGNTGKETVAFSDGDELTDKFSDKVSGAFNKPNQEN